jgi:hypothetical protein
MAGREYKKLVYGRSAFNPPKEMTVGMAEIVTYRVVYGVEIITPTLIAEIPSEPNRQIITSSLSERSLTPADWWYTGRHEENIQNR